MKKEIKIALIVGVISSVIGGILLEIFTTLQILATIKSIAISFGNIFTYTITIPVWGVLFLLFITYLVYIGIMYAKKKSSNTLTKEDYIQDNIFSIDWQWNWAFDGINNLTPLCPECSYQLNLSPTIDRTKLSKGADFIMTKVECDHCGFKKEINDEIDRLKHKVIKEIHRKIRTEEFKEIIDK